MAPSTSVPTRVGDLDRVLRPRSVAVLGASARPGALSGRFLGGLGRHGFAGRVVPVNPARDAIDGLACAPSIAAASDPEPIDLAVVSLPQDKVLGALEECAAAGVGGAVVFASGFSEVSEAGAREERRITALARETGLRVVGPNSPGLINFVDRTCVIASGVGFRPRFEAGGTAIVAQSGGVAGLLVERAQDAGAGLSVAVCTGNEADLEVGELLWWLAEHEPTRVVGLFLEGIRDPEELTGGLDALRTAGKPVVVIKAGATAAAARASAAHTGALAAEDDVVDAFLHRHGALRVHSFDDLVDHAVALERLGPTTTRGVGILSTSGGAGVIATEAAERAGLELPEPAPATRDRLAAALPDFAAVGNPADMSGMFSEKPEIFRASLRAFTDADEFGTAVLVLTVHPPEASDRLADLVIAAQAPDLAVLWTAGAMAAPARVKLMHAGVAVFEDAARCMRALAARTRLGAPPTGEPLPAAAPIALAAQEALTEAEALAVLDDAGVPVAHTVFCVSAEDAAVAAEAADGEVVVKASARDLPHKSDVGAVVVGVTGAEAAARAHWRVVRAAAQAGATPDGSIVQARAPEGLELIVGARLDPVLGAVVVVGPGGLLAELAPQVARRLLPLRPGEARAMLEELTVAPLLHGFRGAPAADVEAAAAAVEALGAAALAIGDRLDVIEVNPLLVHPAGQGGDGGRRAAAPSEHHGPVEVALGLGHVRPDRRELDGEHLVHHPVRGRLARVHEPAPRVLAQPGGLEQRLEVVGEHRRAVGDLVAVIPLDRPEEELLLGVGGGLLDRRQLVVAERAQTAVVVREDGERLDPVAEVVGLDGHGAEHVAAQRDVARDVRDHDVVVRDARPGRRPGHVVVAQVVELLAEQHRPVVERIGTVAEDAVALLAVEDEGVELERRRRPADGGVALVVDRPGESAELRHGVGPEDRQRAVGLAGELDVVGPVGVHEPAPEVHEEREVLGPLLGEAIARAQPEVEHPLLARPEVAADEDEGLERVRPRAHPAHAPADLLGWRAPGGLADEVDAVLVEALPAQRRPARQVEEHGAHGAPALDVHVVVLVASEEGDQLVRPGDVDAHRAASTGATASRCISVSQGTSSRAKGMTTNFVAPAARKRSSSARSAGAP